MVAFQDVGAALLLDEMVVLRSPPPHQSLFVTPVRQRQDPSFTLHALVANVVDEAIDLFQLRPQHFCIAEILVPFLRFGLYLE
jgi:hypothetical protein